MNSLSNKFSADYHVVFTGATSPTGAVVIPTGTIFKGQIFCYGKTTGSTISTSILQKDSDGKIVGVCGKIYVASAGLTITDQVPIVLPAGAYTISTPTGFNDTGSYVGVSGVLFVI